MSTATPTSTNTLLKVILAVLLPPLAVFMERGIGTQFFLNIVLTLIGFWIIGIIHALAVIL
ncbi:YqaE/Pmp3 family membrane protein [Stieleria sp. JC731]|uniref:YqaE/Pmp3 family membrane protein n=1 Tax=Pirellulaceae TaxID=2691357 RepID=UPI001E642A18|nr:YqaE/Pmp3 family membrane protein [Stieleria sp. JC731]MCC9602754.1 YqaE/Pmp3 family membrane protein [Stieleria sp. JC731]